jgi:putative endonuclease
VQSHRDNERIAERKAAQEEYQRNPQKCERRECSKPIPWGRYRKGGARFCGATCARENTADANRAIRHPVWFVYVALCGDGSYYTGITTDINKRIHAHNHTKSGAKYTRSRRPVTLAYSEPAGSRTAASRREAAIKKLSHKEKAKLWTDGLKLGNVNECEQP